MDDAQPVLLAGRYRQLETIGAGGMARVYLAEDERLGRRVAVKRLHADSPSDAAPRFEREARLGASLNHPNLVSIYDIVTESEAVLIVMELVEGRTLREELARGPLGLGTVTAVARDVAAALDHAHEQGIVHRDVKPANILLRDDDGVAKLADLGIATAAASTQITRAGALLGTPAYMAPEQLEGDRVGRAADVYALAAVLYEAIAGEQAVSGSTPVAIAHQVATGPPPDLASVWPDAPSGAVEALAWGMAREPRERPRTAGELATALERGLEESPTQRLSTGEGGGGRGAAGAAGAAAAGGLAGAAAGGLAGAAAGSSRPGEGAGAATAGAGARSDPARVLAERGENASPTRSGGPRVGSSGRGEGTADRPPGHAQSHRGRRVPAWTPVAAVALIALVIAGSLAFGGGGGGGENQASQRAAEGEGGGQGGGNSGSTTDQAPAEEARPAEEPAPAPAPEEEPPADEPPPEEEPAPSGDPVALDAQGYDLIKQGRYQEAVPILQRAVAGFPDGDTSMNHAFALYNLGTALNRSGSPAEAIPYLEQRLAISDFEVGTVRRELEAARRAAG